MSTSNDVDSVELARHLGVFEATMIGVGAMIGAGIFVLTGLATGNAGPAALIAFGLNGVVTLFTAMSYAELSSAIPEAGGGYAYVKKVMPNSLAFLSGWMLWFAYVVACSLYAKGFGSYFLEFFHRYLPPVTGWLTANMGHSVVVSLLTLLVGIAFMLINMVGAHASGQAENIMTLLKIAVLGLFIFFGLWAIGLNPGMTRQNFTPLFPRGYGGVMAAMGLTFIAFEGYDLIATVSEEVEEPETTIPRAIFYSLGITIVIYLLVVFVCVGAVPPKEGTPTWMLLGQYGELGVIEAAGSFMPGFGVVIVLVGGLFATLSALNATILASSRVAFSMGRDWMLPNRLSRIHATRKTPVMAITLSGFLFLVVALFLPLEIIGNASSLMFLLTFILVNASLIVYRRRSSGNEAAFRVPAYPLTPILGILTCAGISLYQFTTQLEASLLALGWALLGWGTYLYFFRTRASISDVSRTLESPELLDLKNVKKYKILVPISNPERVQPLVKLGGQIARSSQGTLLGLSVVELPSVTGYSEAEPLIEQARIPLRKAQELAVQQNVSFSSLLKIGRSAAGEIQTVAREQDCDLILMGYQKEEDPMEDSVIAPVATRQPCDLAVLKSARLQLDRLDRLLVPIRGREVHDRLKVRLIHCIRTGWDCEVVLLTVISTEQPPEPAQSHLDHARRIFQVPEATTRVLESENTAEAIAAETGEWDMVLLGMREEPWFESFFFGPLAQRVATLAEGPTLLTKSRSVSRSRSRRLIRGFRRWFGWEAGHSEPDNNVGQDSQSHEDIHGTG